MGQVSKKLRRITGGYSFYCPGCEDMHQVWIDHSRGANWGFNGNVDAPTFTPSILVTYNGPDAGQLDEDGDRAPPAVCHTFVTDGQIQFLGDCTHAFAGQTVPIPDLPDHLQDD